MATKTLTRYEKLQNLAHKLNSDRGEMPSAYTTRRGKVVGFSPCPKATLVIAACSTDTVLMQVLGEVALEPCPCHRLATVDGLLGWMFLDDWRKEHA